MSENPFEERYRSVINECEEGILAIDSDIRTKYVNQKMAGMLGYDADLMIGVPLFEFMDEEGQKVTMSNISSRRWGVIEKHKFKFRHKSSEYLWVTLITNPFTEDEWRYIERWQ